MRSVLDLFERCVQLDRSIPEEAHLFALNISEPGWLADMIATSLALNYEAKQSLLLLPDATRTLAGVEQNPCAGSGCARAGR